MGTSKTLFENIFTMVILIMQSLRSISITQHFAVPKGESYHQYQL